MKIIEGATAHDLRLALATYLRDSHQEEDGVLWSEGSVVLRCQRPAEMWDVGPTTSPLDLLRAWLQHAAGCEKGITDIAHQLIGRQRAAVYTGDGAVGQGGPETFSYFVEGSAIRCLRTTPTVDVVVGMPSTGLHLELVAAAAGKTAAGIEHMAGFARGPQQEVAGILSGPPVPTVPCPPLISTPLGSWLSDLDTFLRVGSRAIGYKDPFFRNTAVPLHRSMVLLDQGAPQEALVMAATVAHDNWRYLAERWVLGHQMPSGSSQ
jgi:hypothetical protein